MANKDKERENFFRINVLVVDTIKHALVHMFNYYLQTVRKNEMSFEKFIGEHVADIKYLKRSNIIYQNEVDKLIVGDKAISGLKVEDLEVTLVRCLLDNICPELFMDDDCKALQYFLKKHQHCIYHMFKFNERCCQCSQDCDLPLTSQLLQECSLTGQLLEEDQYKRMFKSSSTCAICGPVCAVASCIVTTYIKLLYDIKCIVFGHLSPIYKALSKFRNLRNIAYGHATEGVIPNDRYDVYRKDIEDNIMELARICGNEDETRLALDDIQKRSCDETLCIQYKISLTEQVKRDNELMEGIGENNQKLQGIMQTLEKFREEMRNMNLNKDVGVSCDAFVESHTLQETSSLTFSFKAQINLGSQTQDQLDDRYLEHQHLQTSNNEIPSTSTQPPILGNQNLMNQTNIIERNNLERGQGQRIAVVTSGGLMRNSEPQNSYSLVNPTDDQAGAMTSFSPESSSNNISTGNDQRGQDHQSNIGTDAEPYTSNVNHERVHDLEDKRDIYDGAVLHAEADRDAAIAFINNMERENPDLNITLYDNLAPGTSICGRTAEFFASCRYLFVFVTHNFVKADLVMYLSEVATNATLTLKRNKDRLVPVLTDRTCHVPALFPVQPLKYYHYLEAQEKKLDPDHYFIKCFTKVIDDGRKKYLQ